MIYDGVITKPELNEDLLMHYGVKGMKWKVRKAKGKLLELKGKRRNRHQDKDHIANDPRVREKEGGYPSSMSISKRKYHGEGFDPVIGSADSGSKNRSYSNEFLERGLAAARKRVAEEAKKKKK